MDPKSSSPAPKSPVRADRSRTRSGINPGPSSPSRHSRETAKPAACQSRDFFTGQTSQHTRTLLAEIKRVAKRPFNILITGETGTGKTHAAREIHRGSARSEEPFMELNCANLPEQLVEAELFGYRKGAFTGADRDHKGLFEEADGGILFLDEIGDITPAVQSKLLRAIDEKQIKRLGTNHYRYCDVQIIAATSRDLAKMIEAGQFRDDLFTRLAVLRIETAPLRERREDIPALIAFYLREAAGAIATLENTCEPYRINEKAVALLCECDYPGNIRSLRNLIYELTSYIDEGETISLELVQFALSKVSVRSDRRVNGISDGGHVPINASNDILARSFPNLLVESMTKPGDIILPLDLCVLRKGETFNQWTARAKRCIIEAARRATGGSNKEVAERLALTPNSLRGHLRRAKRVLIEDGVEK